MTLIAENNGHVQHTYKKGQSPKCKYRNRTVMKIQGKQISDAPSKGAPAIECRTYTQLVSPANGPKKKKRRSSQIMHRITVD